MGNSQPFQHLYAVPLRGTESADLSPIIRAATHPDALVDTLENGFQNGWDLFQRGKKIANKGKGPCLGQREVSKDGVLGVYKWMTYEELEDNALALGSALLSGAPKYPNMMDSLEFQEELYPQARTLRMLGIFSVNKVEWFICEQAANAYSMALVPLYDTLGINALVHILLKTGMRTVVSSFECLNLLIEANNQTQTIKYIILITNTRQKVSETHESIARKSGVTLICFWEFLNSGKSNKLPLNLPSKEDIATVNYTSGTTGNPKGVLITQLNVVSCSGATIRGPISTDFDLKASDCTISYLPLAHVLERLVCNVVFAMGARIGVFSGDTTKLLDDVKALKPTVFVSVPRVYNKINDAVFRGVTEKSTIARYFFNKGMSTKLDSLRANASTTNRLWDGLVFNKTRELMGNQLRYMISGGAPLDAVVQERMEVLFCVPLMEGYGMTETFGPAFLANPKDPVAGHVGGPLPCNEFRLRSVPEMNYLVTDSPPKGELLLRGNAITVGYFRDPEETKVTLDDDGWLSTGDICVLLPGCCLKIIDRKKNIFKLAQGEYVAPERVEGIYIQASLVQQVFVFGYSTECFLVGIIVPDPGCVEKYKSVAKIPSTTSLQDVCKSEAFKSALMKELDEVASEAGLKGFEKVKDIYIEPEPLTIEDNLLTPTLKIKRHQAKLKFQAQIDAMYLKNKK